ncbi:hypothetical protein VTN77DRAFT_2828 [Rasamsonia byssochlamydoides]|uniref:uncharacterized protein n=1 Tax=Rasamsonia byssochlamydoides TaxID=89139 RepID=UPI003741E8F0
MPHTARKYRNGPAHNKRVEITDESGWTHVTSTSLATSSRRGRKGFNAIRRDGGGDGDGDDELRLRPAEAPPRLSLAELKRQYEAHSNQWKSSLTWERLQRALQSQVRAVAKSLENVICIGLGSPSGFVRGGWVDRRSVALYQLAALVSVLDLLAQPDIGTHIKNVYAQDPVFNEFDKQLLQSLGITVVEHPTAFNLVNEHSFLYCPGAERTHLEHLLLSAPALVFGGPLESVVSLDSDSDDDDVVLATFVRTRRSLQLPQFEPNIHAFWNMRLYWKEGEVE